MKKIIITILAAAMLFGGVLGIANAQTAPAAEVQYKQTLQLLISLLLKQIEILQAQILELQKQGIGTQFATSTAAIATSTEAIANASPAEQATTTEPIVSGVPTETPVAGAAVPEAPKVVFTKVSDQSFTVENKTSGTLRIGRLEVTGGKLSGIAIEGVQYVAMYKTVNIFDCRGLKSQGIFSSYGNAAFDPCRRNGSIVPRNEILPGEKATILITGSLQGIEYAAGSIMDVATGNIVEFKPIVF